MQHLKSIFHLLLLVLFGSIHNGCELINPEEKIPSFLRIDSISLAVLIDEGATDANFVDARVFANEQLIGVYELPAIIPILEEGETSIRIQAGIKMNGQATTRVAYPFVKDFEADMSLFPDSTVHVNPVVGFRPDIEFAWLENFEGAGLSLEKTVVSEADIVRVGGEEAFDEQSIKLSLAPNQTFFECRKGDAIQLPGGGAPVYLDFTYRCNHAFVVGLFSRDGTGTFTIPILLLNPTEEWNHVYLNLTSIISSNPAFIDHRPYFGFARESGFEDQINVYIDNIRLLKPDEP
ncbi:MAG: hypothetical protein JKX84_03970 [Flavobacteriales bacterium]|nr:hypothetical protein [Flavobacteriales bacterium]